MVSKGEQTIVNSAEPLRTVTALLAAATMERTATVILGYESPITDVISVATAIVSYRRLGSNFGIRAEHQVNETLQQR
jgi:hypothetical protein